MEPVRTPSQSVVIFIFLMITIFNFDKSENASPSSYIELYQDSEEWVVGTANMQSVALPPSLQKNKTSTPDTLYHLVNDQDPKRLRSKFANFVRPVNVVWAAR